MSPEFYRGRVAVAFTACEAHRRPILANPNTFAAFGTILKEAAERHGCTIPIYTLMPDHLHLLVLGNDEEADTKAFMDRFKARTGWWLYRHGEGARWQDDYHDHIVRSGEGWERRACYLALNPVRAGLVEDALAYPFTGSVGYDVREIVLEAFW